MNVLRRYVITIEVKKDNKDRDKFFVAMNNFKTVKDSGNSKFERLDSWLEKESQLYKSEVKNKRKTYIHLKRGTIVKVDFGVNVGSELCHTHFAIVLSKYDNIRQETIIVLPLTSKPGVGRIPLNNLIKKEILNNLKRKGITDNNAKEVFYLLDEYKKYKDFSYAYISQITTVSKIRLIYSNNKYDIINRARCSNEILDKIDDEIIATITGKKIIDMSINEKIVIKT